jgi:hypothetical protein
MAKTNEESNVLPVPLVLQEPGMVRVTAKVDGFRRAGRIWSTMPTIFPTDTFTQTELDALRAEPMLIVEEGNL